MEVRSLSTGVWVSLTLVFLLYKSTHTPRYPMRRNFVSESNLEDALKRRLLKPVVVKEV